MPRRAQEVPIPGDIGDFDTYRLMALRDDIVVLFINGEPAVVADWSELPSTSPALANELGISSDVAAVSFFTIGAMARWKSVSYELCRPRTEPRVSSNSLMLSLQDSVLSTDLLEPREATRISMQLTAAYDSRHPKQKLARFQAAYHRLRAAFGDRQPPIIAFEPPGGPRRPELQPDPLLDAQRRLIDEFDPEFQPLRVTPGRFVRRELFRCEFVAGSLECGLDMSWSRPDLAVLLRHADDPLRHRVIVLENEGAGRFTQVAHFDTVQPAVHDLRSIPSLSGQVLNDLVLAEDRLHSRTADSVCFSVAPLLTSEQGGVPVLSRGREMDVLCTPAGSSLRYVDAHEGLVVLSTAPEEPSSSPDPGLYSLRVYGVVPGAFPEEGALQPVPGTRLHGIGGPVVLGDMAGSTTRDHVTFYHGDGRIDLLAALPPGVLDPVRPALAILRDVEAGNPEVDGHHVVDELPTAATFVAAVSTFPEQTPAVAVLQPGLGAVTLWAPNVSLLTPTQMPARTLEVPALPGSPAPAFHLSDIAAGPVSQIGGHDLSLASTTTDVVMILPDAGGLRLAHEPVHAGRGTPVGIVGLRDGVAMAIWTEDEATEMVFLPTGASATSLDLTSALDEGAGRQCVRPSALTSYGFTGNHFAVACQAEDEPAMIGDGVSHAVYWASEAGAGPVLLPYDAGGEPDLVRCTYTDLHLDPVDVDRPVPARNLRDLSRGLPPPEALAHELYLYRSGALGLVTSHSSVDVSFLQTPFPVGDAGPAFGRMGRAFAFTDETPPRGQLAGLYVADYASNSLQFARNVSTPEAGEFETEAMFRLGPCRTPDLPSHRCQRTEDAAVHDAPVDVSVRRSFQADVDRVVALDHTGGEIIVVHVEGMSGDLTPRFREQTRARVPDGMRPVAVLQFGCAAVVASVGRDARRRPVYSVDRFRYLGLQVGCP